MREVATFMQMYPQYKLRDVLAEYAVVFFRLLNEGYRLRSAERRAQATLALMPYMEAKARESYLRQLELASNDPSDMLKPSTSTNPEADEAKLKKLLG